MKFFTDFKEVYDEISRDLLSRLEELQELNQTCKIAHEFQQSNKKLKKSISTQNLNDNDSTTINRSIYEILSSIEWEELTSGEKLVEQFLQDAQVYYD